MVEPLSTQCEEAVSSTYHVQYDHRFKTVKAAGLSLIGFESVVENSVYIKSSIGKFNTSHVAIEVSCHEMTLFNRLRFSYIIVHDTVMFLEIYSVCYLCEPKDSSDGIRWWEFSYMTHTKPFSEDIQLSTSMSGFNVTNEEGDGLRFGVNAVMKLGDDRIYHQIYAW